MSYPSLPLVNAAAIFTNLQNDEQAFVEPAIVQRQGQNWKPKMELEDLLAELMDLYATHGLQSNAAFESIACVVLHQGLAPTPEAAADPCFWCWLSLGPLLPLVRIRHESLRPEHVGLGSPWDALLSRMWFRADLVMNPDDEDPYSLAVLGDLDFWRSHVLRADYSACRQLLRALVRFQYPDAMLGMPRLKPSGNSEDGIRALAKRIKLRHALVAFELLEEEDCWLELETLAEGLN